MKGAVHKFYFGSRRGNVSITTALVGLMLATAAGAAFDTGRQVTTSQKLQSMSDAAALAAMAEPGLSGKQRQQIAIRAVENLASQSGANFGSLSVEAQPRQGEDQIYVSLATDLPMLFGALMGKDSQRVSVESLSEEFLGVANNSMSISVVLDLSSSMAEGFDRGSKIATVKAALSEVFGDNASANNMKSGVYGFNWGQVGAETAPLAPGTAHVRNMLTYAGLGEGSVPTTAMEAALRDQAIDRENSPASNRFIIFITDGDVDNEKADKRGQYISERRQLSDESKPECPGALGRVEETRDKLAHHYNNIISTNGLLGTLSPITAATDSLISDVISLSDMGQGAQRLERWLDKHDKAQQDVEEYCVFEQTDRVLNVCEAAPAEEDISIIAINMSGEGGEAETITQECLQSASRPRATNRNQIAELTPFSDLPTKKLANGLEVSLSDDGQSMYAAVESLDDLRHVLSSMMPERKMTRTVRLVR